MKAMVTIEIPDDFLLPDESVFQPESELCKHEDEDTDDQFLVAQCAEPERMVEKEPDWEIKVGEDVLIDCGEDNIPSFWWELEFDGEAFCGPCCWTTDMGEHVEFKLKSLKKGDFNIRAMLLYCCPDDNGGTYRIDWEFTVKVRVL